jgi:hypothetical protein
VDDPALEQQLAIETMSDAELEAALAAELAVMERSIGAPAEASDDAPRPAASVIASSRVSMLR